ncbi:MAG TPA: alkaline phosphatase family protein [Chloroflexota bacterium]|nr:alkaline phosphatase family protein [Chloroflexota bacterium]
MFSVLGAVVRALKQAATLQRLKLPFSGYERRRCGFVVLQIDALSQADLEAALKGGFMPHLRELIEGGRYRVEGWRCGMPSDTAAIQCAMWYGDKSFVPGFYWYDKKQRKPIICSWPLDMARVEAACAGPREGLLRHGSVYTGMAAGGASRAVLTTSALGNARFPPKLTGIDIFLLLLLNPWRLGRASALTVREIFTEIVEQSRARLHGRYVAPEGIFPITRAFTHVLFRELSTLGVRLDIFRGVPAIYANFIGYDEIAHHLGPNSRYAYRCLRAIDRQIHDVYKAVQASSLRDYDLYIMSDHGMTPSLPFQHLYGQTLGQFMSSHNARRLETVELEPGIQRDLSVIQQVEELSDEVGPRTSSLTRLALDRLARLAMRIGTGPLQAGLSENADSPILAVYSSSLANVYFTAEPERLDISDIERIAPDLLRSVVQHEGIGLVLGRESGKTVVLCREGAVYLEDAEPERLEFLRQYDEPALIAEQLISLAAIPNSGDLLVFGAARDGMVINFEDHAGAHGGLGGVQAFPFMAIPAGAPMVVSGVTDATELYSKFEEHYWGRGAASRQVERRKVLEPTEMLTEDGG